MLASRSSKAQIKVEGGPIDQQATAHASLSESGQLVQQITATSKISVKNAVVARCAAMTSTRVKINSLYDEELHVVSSP